jgi:hypothetical protein
MIGLQGRGGSGVRLYDAWSDLANLFEMHLLLSDVALTKANFGLTPLENISGRGIISIKTCTHISEILLCLFLYTLLDSPLETDQIRVTPSRCDSVSNPF